MSALACWIFKVIYMFIINEERMTVLSVISVALGLCMVIYCILLRMEAKQQALIAHEIAQFKNASAKVVEKSKRKLAPEKKTTSVPRIPKVTPLSQANVRHRHVNLVQRSIVTRFRDVDTFFQARDLSNSARLLSQWHAENNSKERAMMMQKLYHVPRMVPQPAVRTQPRQRTPWLPGPGSYDPIDDDPARLPASLADSEFGPVRGYQRSARLNEDRVQRWLEEAEPDEDDDRGTVVLQSVQERRGVTGPQEDGTLTIRSGMTHISI